MILEKDGLLRIRTSSVCVLTAALLWVFVGALTWATVEGALLLRESRRRLVDTSTNLNAVLLQTGIAADNVRRASEKWEAASDEQQKYWRDISKETREAVKELRASVKRTDTNLNDRLLPEMTRFLQANDQRLAGLTNETIVSLQDTTTRLNALLDSTTSAADSAKNLFADPNIPKSLENIEQSTENINKTTAHIEKKVEQMTKPANLAVRVGFFVLDLGAKVGTILIGFFK